MLNFVKNTNITSYCIPNLKFLYYNTIRNSEYSHTLACDHQVLKMFGKGNYEDEKNKMLEIYNIEKRLLQITQGPYDYGCI